jgi:FkbM family methyltransferase
MKHGIIETARRLAKWGMWHALARRDPAAYHARRAQAMRLLVRLDAYERRHLRFLAACVGPGDTVVDVGAHFGAYTLALAARVGPRGRVLAFEPLPRVFAELCASTRGLPQVECIEAALSDRAADARAITVPFIAGEVPEPALASLEPSAGKGLSTMVRVERLDDRLALLDGLTFVKVDAEGHDVEVLRGAERTLRRHRPLVQLEVGDEEALRRARAFAEAIGATLRRLGDDGALAPLDARARERNLYLAFAT